MSRADAIADGEIVLVEVQVAVPGRPFFAAVEPIVFEHLAVDEGFGSMGHSARVRS